MVHGVYIDGLDVTGSRIELAR